MDDVLRALVLGIIEGLTEFLPVSSTGHMILAMPLLGIDETRDPWPAFLYFVQIGAILAVVIYFWSPLISQILRWPVDGLKNHLLVKLVVATIPAAAIGLPFNESVERLLEKPLPVAIALILGAAVLAWIDRRYRHKSGPTVEQITLRQALLVGLAQCVSIIPGTSRAMATIMGGMLVGMPPATAAEFSFYLAIPTLLGAGLVRLLKDRHILLDSGYSLTLVTGFVMSGLVAGLVVHGFLRYVRTRSLAPFAIYRVALGLTVIIWWTMG